MINQSLIQSLSQAKKKREAKQSFEVRTVSPSKKKKFEHCHGPYGQTTGYSKFQSEKKEIKYLGISKLQL